MVAAMADRAEEPQNQNRRLTVDFAAWLDDEPVTEAEFYKRGLVVLDTNALLDLYRVNPDTRGQVIKALEAIGDRLWVPHQAAVEFARNRKQAVIDWQGSFKQVRLTLREAAASAVEVLQKALADLERLRLRSNTARTWDPGALGLDRDSLMERLDGVMDPAIAELKSLQADHDTTPKDMQSVDAVLKQVDQLLAGRIGAAYNSTRLRELIDEAMEYRYPNKIPPGFRDAGKNGVLRQIGDFLLWQQTIDRANALPSDNRLVLLITQEEKPDWWKLDDKGDPIRPHPELVQEMRDAANAHLRLVSLADYLNTVGRYTNTDVSDEAVDELRRATAGLSAFVEAVRYKYSQDRLDLLTLSPQEFELIVLALLGVMGYPGTITPLSHDQGADATIHGDGEFGRGKFLVDARRYRSIVDLSAIHALYGVLAASDADGALLVTTSWFARAGKEFAEGKNIHLIEGNELVRLLAENLGIDTFIGLSR
jgi:hypothetical protein